MSVKRLFSSLLIIALFAMAVRETLDADMWWHLKAGSYIAQNGIPHQDIFSYTVPNHEWVTHEWLSEVVMWWIYRTSGFAGLIVSFALIIVLTYWLVFLSCEGRPYVAGFVTLLAALASALVWGARPQIFNLLMTALFVFIVTEFQATQKRRLLWWLIPLTVLWANLHSGYLLGVVLLGTYVVGFALDLWLGDKARPLLGGSEIRYLAGVTVLSFFAAALNPNGVTLWVYPFLTLGSSAMQAYIQEWHSPNFHVAAFWPFAAMLAFGVVGWLVNGKRPSWTETLLFLGTGGAGLLSSRHIPLFAIVAAPIVARRWTDFVRRRWQGDWLIGEIDQLPSGPMALLNWIILVLACFGAVIWTGQTVAGNEAAIAERFPVDAVDYLEISGLAVQPGYNSYNWGGYLIWRDIPVFVDGRADVYGDAFLFFYRQAFEARSTWQEPLDAFDVAYVVMETGSPLTTVLDVHPNWEEAYRDDVAQIFVRRGGQP